MQIELFTLPEKQIDTSKPIIDVFTDGATEGVNDRSLTTHIGIGVFIPQIDVHYSERLEGISNNEAEYEAVLAGMKILIEEGYDQARFFCDSNIVVYGASGRSPKKTKHKKMQEYREKCRELREAFSYIDFTWIPRDKNYEADRLSKLNLIKG